MPTPGSTATPLANVATSTLDATDGEACRPNISPAGRRARIRMGRVAAAAAALGVGAAMALESAWYWRAVVALPAAGAAIGFLQARRGTCVARAAEGTFEHDDFSKSLAAPADVARSRRVAATITRDTVLIGAAAGLLGAATTLVR